MALSTHSFSYISLLFADVIGNFNVLTLFAEKYELAELDRKKPKVVRRAFTTPFIRYQSTAMPLIQEIKSSEEMEVEEPSVDVDTQVYYVILS